MSDAILIAVGAICNLIDGKATAEVIRWCDEGMTLLRVLWQAQGLSPDDFDRAVDEARIARENAAKAQREAEEKMLRSGR